MRFFVLLSFYITLVSSVAYADEEVVQVKPLLVIGASFANGKIPFNDHLSSPLLGLSVAGGSYLSLGDALIRNRKFEGWVINEAQAGATTFERPSCRAVLYGDNCGTAIFDSYSIQLQRAVARVRSLTTGALNADYVLVTMPNDCLHSDAQGVPESQSIYCTEDDMHLVAERLASVGQEIVALGLTPIFGNYMPAESYDAELFRQSSLVAWTISAEDLQRLGDIVYAHLSSEVPEALIIDYWRGFENLGDGLHPNRETTIRAARRVLKQIGYVQEDWQ